MNTLSESIKQITKDPINLFLAIIPTMIALAVYIFAVVFIFQRSDYLGLLVRDYLPTSEVAGVVGKILTAILILFIFLLMSWTFVIVVGIIASPFNSMLSARIENRLAGKPNTDDRSKTLSEMVRALGSTFKTEVKKLFFIAFAAVFALVLNIFPLFYPVGLMIVALLFAVQFVDYSWSRHDMKAGECWKDVLKNIIPYGFSGLMFLVLITIPVINAIVPAFATSYFTVLWLKRQKRIQ